MDLLDIQGPLRIQIGHTLGDARGQIGWQVAVCLIKQTDQYPDVGVTGLTQASHRRVGVVWFYLVDLWPLQVCVGAVQEASPQQFHDLRRQLLRRIGQGGASHGQNFDFSC